jgi:hypothetical protein
MTVVAVHPQAPTTGAGPAGPGLTQRIGFEIELLAPRGASRADLAEELARRHGGTVELIFHVDSEPSLVPGMTHFLHLTHGFVVRDGAGTMVCQLVDDITIRQDVDSHAAAQPGWYRIVATNPPAAAGPDSPTRGPLESAGTAGPDLRGTGGAGGRRFQGHRLGRGDHRRGGAAVRRAGTAL